MPTIKTYNDATVTVLRSTEDPGYLAKAAVDLTQKKLESGYTPKAASRNLLRFILDARHGSVIEHCSITFILHNVSRSFLAQITRHRMSSFTSASQHYQDYRDYPMVVHPIVKEEPVNGATRIGNEKIERCLQSSLDCYTDLVDKIGVPPEEARQVLPNASAVSIIWTVNARSLENFFYQRLCRRNVAEMRIVAEKIYRAACEWWPELFEQVGPACFRGSCDQGKMTCGKAWKPEAERHSLDVSKCDCKGNMLSTYNSGGFNYCSDCHGKTEGMA